MNALGGTPARPSPGGDPGRNDYTARRRCFSDLRVLDGGRRRRLAVLLPTIKPIRSGKTAVGFSRFFGAGGLVGATP
jgi:hypothetical protein